jgi:hypothetical protein
LPLDEGEIRQLILTRLLKRQPQAKLHIPIRRLCIRDASALRGIHGQIRPAEMHGICCIEHLAAKFQTEAFGQLEVARDQQIQIAQARRA